MNILGIDIGGSAIKAAPVNTFDGSLAAERLRLATPQPATPDAVADTVAKAIGHFNWSGPIGCGLPSVVRNGIACTAANIDPAWVGVDVVELLSSRSGLATRVLNDADAAGLAEMRYGAGSSELGTCLVITVGTGLGTALFRDKILVPNTELGHLQLHGKVAEQIASAAVRTELKLSYREWAKRFDDYLHRLEDLFWPDMFIIGGEISKAHDQFFPYLTIKTRIMPAAFRNDAGIIGAAIAALPQG
ncbi:MAG: ROK family protein [Desulfuromonadales bacterium]|nr:ROK family protein [Desulfuromonadales bacterium]